MPNAKVTRTLPYENASSGDRAIRETERMLERFGCSEFGTMQDVERGETLLHFKHRGRTINLRVSWRGYAATWLQAHPYSHRMRISRPTYEQRALEQGKVAVCSIVRDWAKAQIMMIEAGLMAFEEVFFGQTLLPSGQRVIDHARANNLLPAPEASS